MRSTWVISFHGEPYLPLEGPLTLRTISSAGERGLITSRQWPRQSMSEISNSSRRDHLFLSYATEDSAFARWLTVKLIGEGYRVWCDQIQLLGGESYPRDIDRAIKETTFRFLAVITEHSLRKENPRKERTIALNLARERKEDFLIPINLGGVSATDLDWMISDLTYIPFDRSWATGLQQLLQKLNKIRAPKTFATPLEALTEWASRQDLPPAKPERLWSNVYTFKSLPRSLIRVEIRDPALKQCFNDWPIFRESGSTGLTLTLPRSLSAGKGLKVTSIDWRRPYSRSRLPLTDVLLILLRESIQRLWRERGLRLQAGDHRGRRYHFTPEETGERWLTFKSYTGEASRVKAVGARTFPTTGEPEIVRYHLSPLLKPTLHLFDAPVVITRLFLYLTSLDGTPLETKHANRRRKGICKNWWNHHWLSRQLAVMEVLSGASPVIDLTPESGGEVLLNSTPRQCTIPVGIDEQALAAPTSKQEGVDSYRETRASDFEEPVDDED